MILMWLLACGHEEPEPERRDPLERVAWMAPVPATRQVLVTLPAEVEALPDALHTFGPRVAGRVTRWLVEPGDTVEVGRPLAVVESASLRGLAASVDGQRKVRDARQARLDAGFGTVADVAEAEAALAMAAAELDATRGVLRPDGRGAVWSSPRAGVVSAIRCAQGVEVGPADACISVVEPGRVGVLTHVPERHLRRLDGVVGRWAGNDGGAAGELALRTRAPEIDRASRTLAVRFDGAGALLPGSSGRIDLIVPIDEAWELPESAIVAMEGDDVVFIRTPEGAQHVSVEVLGRGERERTRLVRGPLRAEHEVAWRGVFLLKSLALLEEGGHP